MKYIPSPHQDKRFDHTEVRFLILHYTACDFPTALRYLTQEKSQNPVSAHYLIDRDGTTVQLVRESQRAWHAGLSRWGPYEGLNTWSVGIELVNLGHELGYPPFPEAQMAALIPLCQQIIRRHPIPAAHVLGHADIAPRRKKDPGERLDWRRLSQAGIGLQIPQKPKKRPFDKARARQYLKQIGYDVREDREPDAALRAALRAFCMRCVPSELEALESDTVMGALEDYLALLEVPHNVKSGAPF